MRTLAIVKHDPVIYWKKTGVDDEGNPLFADPIVIKGRWDIVSADSQSDDAVETEVHSNTLYPDRVLVVGSFVHFGDESVLNGFTEEEKADPRLLPGARKIKDQSTIYELRWRQKVVPDHQSEHLVIECHL